MTKSYYKSIYTNGTAEVFFDGEEYEVVFNEIPEKSKVYKRYSYVQKYLESLGYSKDPYTVIRLY